MIYHRILNILLCAITYCCYIRECLFPQEINTKRLGGVSKKILLFSISNEEKEGAGEKEGEKRGRKKGRGKWSRSYRAVKFG